LGERHESLRTTFVVLEGEPRQRIHASLTERLEVIDLSGERDPAARARDLAREHAGRPFDLERGPLGRLTVLRLAAERHVLLFNIHHIIADDWSLGVLVNEFVRAYDAGAQGETWTPPTLPLHYRDYATWQNARLAGEGM